MILLRTKKDREWYYLRRAMSVCDLFPSVEPTASESPDFLFELNGSILGIEMVDLIQPFCGSPNFQRAAETLREKTMEDAKAVFETRHGFPMWVAGFWDDRFILTQRKTATLAERIAAAVAKHLPEETYGGFTLQWDELRHFQLEDALLQLHGSRLKPTTKSLWCCTEAGPLGVPVDAVQRLVDDKANKLNVYMKKCHEVWLLLVADSTHISSCVDFEDAPQITINSAFAKTLLYSEDSNAIMVLA